MSDQYPEHLQDLILHLLIVDTEFCNTARPSLELNQFSSRPSRTVFELATTFYDRYKKAPKDHFFDEFEKEVAATRDIDTRSEDFALLLEYIEVLRNAEANRDYILARIHEFIRQRALENVVVDLAEAVSSSKFDDAESLMQGALKAGITRIHQGIEYYYDDDSLVDRMIRKPVVMKTLIPHLDRVIGGFRRTWLICLLGAYKGKKTWGLISLGRAALNQGLVVVHLTHELTELETRMRYDQSIAWAVDPQFSSRNLRVPYFVNENSTDVAYESHTFNTIYDIDYIRKKLKVFQRYGGRLFIRGYPMGTCRIKDVVSYLDFLEVQNRIVPDVLITDYAGIMCPDNKNQDRREGLNQINMDLKSIAQERGIIVLTANQTTRTAISKPVAREVDLAEDIRTAATADLIMSINQTDKERANNQARLFGAVFRHGPAHFHILCTQLIECGQFAMDSCFYRYEGEENG